MKRLSKILGPNGKPLEIEARFDSARTTPENRKHWAAADDLGPSSSLTPDVRRITRNRTRYEIANNSYAKGLLLTWAFDLIGTGPSLQGRHKEKSVNRTVEGKFYDWWNAVNLTSKLQTCKLAKSGDGEMLAMFTNNDQLRTPVQLDFVPFESDYLENPWDAQFNSKYQVDGIRYDKSGNPTAYYLLNEHPGDMLSFDMGGKWVAARNIVHLYRADRPGQLRGISEILASLHLFAQLRRYTLAVVAAAEVAADIAGVMVTKATPNGEDAQLVPDFDTQELARRMLVALPPTYELQQLHAEQPTTTYAQFKREILLEIARCLNMPYAIAAGDSSDSNYASGRLEVQSWQITLEVERKAWEMVVLDRIFAMWLDEAINIPNYLPSEAAVSGYDFPHSWFWPNRPHVDPQKEATALEKLLNINGTTLARWHAQRNEDWEEVLEQRAREKAREKELGVAPITKSFGPPSGGRDEEEEPEDKEEKELNPVRKGAEE